MTVIEAFKRFRKEFKLTRADVAEALGIKAISYDYENPDKSTNPTAKTLIKLADKYNISVDYLLGRTDNPLSHLANADLQRIDARLARIEKFLADKS